MEGCVSYNNIGVILIFIMSFNIEDTSTSSFIQTYYMPHGWQLRNFLCGNFQLKETGSCLISTKKQRFEENVSFNKRNSTQRPRTARSTYVIESTLPKDFKQKRPFFLSINYLTILYFSWKGLENINATIEDIYVCIREY